MAQGQGACDRCQIMRWFGNTHPDPTPGGWTMDSGGRGLKSYSLSQFAFTAPTNPYFLGGDQSAGNFPTGEYTVYPPGRYDTPWHYTKSLEFVADPDPGCIYMLGSSTNGFRFDHTLNRGIAYGEFGDDDVTSYPDLSEFGFDIPASGPYRVTIRHGVDVNYPLTDYSPFGPFPTPATLYAEESELCGVYQVLIDCVEVKRGMSRAGAVGKSCLCTTSETAPLYISAYEWRALNMYRRHDYGCGYAADCCWRYETGINGIRIEGAVDSAVNGDWDITSDQHPYHAICDQTISLPFGWSITSIRLAAYHQLNSNDTSRPFYPRVPEASSATGPTNVRALLGFAESAYIGFTFHSGVTLYYVIKLHDLAASNKFEPRQVFWDDYPSSRKGWGNPAGTVGSYLFLTDAHSHILGPNMKVGLY